MGLGSCEGGASNAVLTTMLASCTAGDTSRPGATPPAQSPAGLPPLQEQEFAVWPGSRGQLTMDTWGRGDTTENGEPVPDRFGSGS
jgi:hypothetical protein